MHVSVADYITLATRGREADTPSLQLLVDADCDFIVSRFDRDPHAAPFEWEDGRI